MPIWDVADIDEFYPEDKDIIDEEEDEGWNEDDDLDSEDDEFENDEPTEEDLRRLGIKP